MNSFRPHFPGGLLARPEFIQVLVFAVGVHGIEEPVVAVSHELTFARQPLHRLPFEDALWAVKDRKSTRLNSSHTVISYAVFCLKKEKDTSELQSHSNLVCLLLLVKLDALAYTPGKISGNTPYRYCHNKVHRIQIKTIITCTILRHTKILIAIGL